ncbi:hypothetical protein [Pararhizobium mangrovi]|uniref:Uncharacterized protein n=1 Tax=Pararhizobium mangrovi TaxID=2590452 RepID=A0A506TVC4_9HYPH|nr:hypothetical protein [Pararhizobium mangrovi]TPW26013.1 hypothetical protein FJU11_16490 [Pararhizobium mangrovi]
MTERFPTDNELQSAWDDYVCMRDEAERTRNLNDGILAGKLWRRFVYLFADPDKVLADNTVVQMPTVGDRQARGRAS